MGIKKQTTIVKSDNNNWNTNTNMFIPFKNEIIIYQPDDDHPDRRYKIGDGITHIHDLPFVPEKDAFDVLLKTGDTL